MPKMSETIELQNGQINRLKKQNMEMNEVLMNTLKLLDPKFTFVEEKELEVVDGAVNGRYKRTGTFKMVLSNIFRMSKAEVRDYSEIYPPHEQPIDVLWMQDLIKDIMRVLHIRPTESREYLDDRAGEFWTGGDLGHLCDNGYNWVYAKKHGKKLSLNADISPRAIIQDFPVVEEEVAS